MSKRFQVLSIQCCILLTSLSSFASRAVDIANMPQPPSAATASSAVPGSDEPSCKQRIPAPLRAMIFGHYINFVKFSTSRGQDISPQVISKWAHLTGMIMKESSGDSGSVTDMKGHEKSTYKASTNLSRWNALMDHGNITYDKQTNYGVAQQSPDRLRMTFSLNTGLDDFLTGTSDAKSNQSTRKLFEMYQQFAQGRLAQEDEPISPAALKNSPSPEILARSKAGIDAALWHCGTGSLFQEGAGGEEGQAALRRAMASIAYCDMGATNDPKSTCAARWLTLCPALNIDIALLNPDSYFQTRSAAEACTQTFKKLTVQYSHHVSPSTAQGSSARPGGQ